MFVFVGYLLLTDHDNDETRKNRQQNSAHANSQALKERRPIALVSLRTQYSDVTVAAADYHSCLALTIVI